MKLVIVFVALCSVITMTSAACSEPPHKWYTQSFQSAFVDAYSDTLPGNSSLSGTQFGKQVVDTAKRRVWLNFTAEIALYGEYSAMVWAFYGPVGSFRTTICAIVDEECHCNVQGTTYQSAVPKTATFVGKRRVMGATGLLWSNVSSLWTTEITSSQDCIIRSTSQTNNDKLPGVPTGGCLTSFYDYSGITEATADSILALPPSCHPVDSAAPSTRRNINHPYILV